MHRHPDGMASPSSFSQKLNDRPDDGSPALTRRLARRPISPSSFSQTAIEIIMYTATISWQFGNYVIATIIMQLALQIVVGVDACKDGD